MAEILSAENKKQIWIPEGFAHGFITLSEHAEFLYKTTEYYAPECERCIRWDDPKLDIKWPVVGEPRMSDKDQTAPFFVKAECFS
jgi:dTDP-4-dehydrorhamnose 3,5-epimerase